MKSNNINAKEMMDVALICLEDKAFKKKVLFLLNERYSTILVEFFLNNKDSIYIGDLISRSNQTTQKMILKLAASIVNLYRNNDYTKHEDLSLKIYFDIFLRAKIIKPHFNVGNIDFVLGIVPERVQRQINDKYFPVKGEWKTIGKYTLESNSYHIIRFHAVRYEEIPEFYSLLTNKELFLKELEKLKPSKKDKMIARYINCYPADCNDCSHLTENQMISNMKKKQ